MPTAPDFVAAALRAIGVAGLSLDTPILELGLSSVQLAFLDDAVHKARK